MHYWLLFSIAVILLYASTKIFTHRINPATAFLSTWALQFLLLALPIFDYLHDQITWPETTYISAALLIAFVGFALGSMVRGEHRETQSPSIAPFVIGALGLVGQLAILYDVSVVTGLSISDRVFGNVSDLIREYHFEDAEQERYGPLTLLESYLAPLSFISIALYYARDRFNNQPAAARTMIAATFAMICINALYSQGGRIGIIFAIALALAARHLSKPISMPKKSAVLAFAAVICLGWFFSVGFVQKRLGTFADPMIFLNAGHRTDLHPIAQEIANNSDTAGFLFFSLSYPATATPTLVRYLKLEGAEIPGPFYGAYSFPLVARPIIRAFGDTPRSFWEIRRDIFWVLRDYGFHGNVWATGVRDLMMDFGRAGGLIVLFILTLLSGAVYAKSQYGDATLKALASFVMLGCFWFSFHTPTFMGIYFTPVVYLSLYLLVRLPFRIAPRLSPT